ncbi:MAG: bifunctional 5,10-methylenetetrahydrofolate dehydrogenase/5,10-methenyltetrahydrofolate cyclohydrolase [bacterium]|nr:bifunctional 5,10-methylenetetrahydrofolate dehydrogenase/5,10-methenyltetrahydrofolate cyclohydrolase [bacterium]
MKILNGAELKDFIKERQAKQVRGLRQSWQVFPRLVIFYSNEDPVIETYMRLKISYAEDILIEAEKRFVSPENLAKEIQKANLDETIHGIIVQLPLKKSSGEKIEGEELRCILSQISPEKDVDGLSGDIFISATAQAINWLLVGYNIELQNKKIAIVGQGLLVGRPLGNMWRKSGYDVTVFDKNNSVEMKECLSKFDIVVSATGVPGLITSGMLKPNAVVVDAGTASENGIIKGDVAEDVRQDRKDVIITPKIGGVGPLTIASLIDNVIISARKIANRKGQQDL